MTEIGRLNRYKVHVLLMSTSTILYGPNGITITPKLTKQQQEAFDLIDECIDELLRLRVQ